MFLHELINQSFVLRARITSPFVMLKLLSGCFNGTHETRRFKLNITKPGNYNRVSILLLEALAVDVIDAQNRGEQDILDNRAKDFERILITKALQHTGGRRIEAAHQLGIGRNTLTRKIQELGIDG